MPRSSNFGTNHYPLLTRTRSMDGIPGPAIGGTIPGSLISLRFGICYGRLGRRERLGSVYDGGLLTRYPDDAELLTFRGITQVSKKPAAVCVFREGGRQRYPFGMAVLFPGLASSQARRALPSSMTQAEKGLRRAVNARRAPKFTK